MAQPTLDQRFVDGPPSRGESEIHRRMTSNERRFILWGIKEGWSAARIARALGVNEATVRRFRAKFTRDPKLLLRLGLFEVIGRAKDDEYRCLVCGDQLLGRSEIERHVLLHYLDESTVLETPPAPEVVKPGLVTHSQTEAPDSRRQRDRNLDPDGLMDSTANPFAAQQTGSSGDIDSLVSRIRSDPALARMLSDLLGDVARNQREPVGQTQAPSSDEDTGSPPESLTLDQVRRRRSEGHSDSPDDAVPDGDESSGTIPLPPPGQVENVAPTAWIVGDQVDDADRESVGDVGYPPGRRDLAGPTPDEMSESRKRREAFERLKAQAAGHKTAPDAEPTVIDTPPQPPLEFPGVGGQGSKEGDFGERRARPEGVDIEREVQRAAFERLQAQATEQVGGPTHDMDGPEAEQRRRELESILGEPIAPGDDQGEKERPEATSDSGTARPDGSPDDEARRTDFARLRQEAEAGVRETVSPYIAEDADDEVPPLGGMWPAGPAEDPESQGWHDAFERLASEKQGSGGIEDAEADTGPSPAEPVSSIPPAGDGGAAPGPAGEGLDMSSWHEAFQKLTTERGAAEDVAGRSRQEPPVEGMAPTRADDGLTAAFEPEGSRHGADLDDHPPEPPETSDSHETSNFPISEQPSDESAARLADFERLRREALGESGPPAPAGPSSPPTGEAAPGSGEPAETVPAGVIEFPPVEPAMAETQVDGPPEADGPGEASGEGRPFGLPSLRIPTLGGRVSLATLGSRGSDILARISTSKPMETTTLAVEHGFIKLLVTRGQDVLDYRIVPANPVLFREGMVSDVSRMAALLKRTLQDLEGDHRRVVGTVPGYQTNLRRIGLPNVRRMDPKVAIPSEARRTMGISPENSHLSWRPLPGPADTSNWLVVSATNRSISSISAMADGAGLSMKAIELRPFAVARATNQPDAVFAWTAADGCDAVVVRDWVPITYQSAYWGADSEVEPPDLVNRITEVVESTMAAHNVESPEMAVSKEMPLFVYGSPTGKNESIGTRVALNVGMATQEPEIPLHVPSGLPVQDLIVNIGLALWED